MKTISIYPRMRLKSKFQSLIPVMSYIVWCALTVLFLQPLVAVAVPLAATETIRWAKAAFAGAGLGVDELKQVSSGFLLPAQTPFSFVYDGKRSDTLLPVWQRTLNTQEAQDRLVHTVQWTDPQTGLRLVATVTAFKNFPAVEWLLRFENRGTQDTPILENVQALDLTLPTAPADRPVVLHQIAGSDASERDFVPSERELKPGENVRLAPAGGRSSSGTFPFFNLQFGDSGMITAVGWTGQWAASLNRTAAGPTRLQAGMELTHLLLHPGEAVRTPRILLLRWSGERIDGCNQFRRLLLAHYLPKLDGEPVLPCIGSQSFNRWYRGSRPVWNTESGQIAAAKITRDLGCDTHWLDASWFEGGFSAGVGNWTVLAKAYPNGLKPVGDACKKLGLKFLVWYEPERVKPGTRIAREFPEFVLGGAGGGLFNLGQPKARQWMTDLLNTQIDQFGIATYRNDFNMDPLAYWRRNDPPDRQGITEISYIEGLYQMWDEIRARHPGMYLDDCASGGRRIDLEMCLRSIVQTRSDAACAPGRAEWDQSQTYGLSFYFPAHATIGWEVTAYDCRSIATAGFLGEWDILDPKFPKNAARASIAEIKENQKYWYGDYYPLTPWTMAPDKWMAYQFHRPDLEEGIVLAFRHKDSPYPALQVCLRGLKPEQSYRVSFSDEERKVTTKTMSGRELAATELRLDKPRSSLLVRYQPSTR